mmetsp:Transcript_29370/g.36304  ORF Transcript_29370/g.36304 Transcript_29370/m.36304 type:complete len:86 (-) Transcript_29370:128-385(-)
MVLCPEHISKVRIGPLSSYTIEYLRLVKTLFEVKFKIVGENTSPILENMDNAQEYRSDLPMDPKYNSVLLSCRGVGFKNLSRKVT